MSNNLLTIFIAPSGTTLRSGGTSGPGHMYFTITQGGSTYLIKSRKCQRKPAIAGFLFFVAKSSCRPIGRFGLNIVREA